MNNELKHNEKRKPHLVMGVMKRFFDLDLAMKLPILFCGMIFVVLIFTALVLFSSGQHYVQNEQETRSIQTLEYVQIMIEKEQKYLEGLTEYYSSSVDAQELVQRSNNGMQIQPELFQELLKSARFKMYLLSVVFYNRKGDPIDFVSIDNSYGPVSQGIGESERPFERLMSSHQDMEWEYIPQYSEKFMNMDHSAKLVLWKKIKDSNTQRTIGAVSVSVDVRKLLASDINYNSSLNVFLLSEQGEIALNRTGAVLSEEVAAHLCEYANSKTQVYKTRLNQQDYILCYKIYPGTPFIGCVIEQDNISFWSETSIIQSALLIICLFLLTLLPLAWASGRMLTRPLKILSDSMVRFSKGDYGAEVAFKYDDDIGRLGKVFNTMVEENRRLVDLNYVLKLREKEAELSMLQMQIDPHFLYNMLNSVYWSAMKNHDEQTAEIAYSMGQFFRLSLNRGSDATSIRNCLDLVHHYLELQQSRFGNRIQWTINADPNIYDAMIPKLIIQPIVENCIVHGLDSSIEKLIIHVQANISEDQSKLIFVIEDNGVGIPEDVLVYLPGDLDEQSNGQGNIAAGGQRFALRNINERLRIRYQDQYEFVISNRLGGGTHVYLSLPNELKEV